MIYETLVAPFLKENAKTFIVYSIIVLIFFPLEGLAIPSITGKIFDQLSSGNLGKIDTGFFENIKLGNVPGLMSLLAITWMIITIVYGLKHHVEGKLIPDYLSHVRSTIYEKTLHSVSGNFKQIKTGEYLSRIFELCRNFKDMFQYSLSRFIPEVSISLIIIGFLMFTNLTLGITLFTGFIISAIIQYFGTIELIDKIEERELHFHKNISEKVQDSLNNLMNIYINNEIDAEIDTNKRIEYISANKLKHISFIENVVILLTQLATVLSFSSGLYVLYKMLRQKKITNSSAIIGILVMGQYMNYFFYANSGFVNNIAYKLGIINASKHFIADLNNSSNIGNRKDGITDKVIEFKNVSYRHDKNEDKWLFKDYNLMISGSSNVGITGRSGTGKSTLMKMLIGLYTPEKGDILIDGINIKDFDPTYLRNQFVYINQDTHLFNETILYNMMYGTDLDEETVIQFVQKYNLDSVFSEIPDGIYASAGVNGTNLSGGMQKMTMIIRGVLKSSQNNATLIMDEPSVGLDEKTMDIVLYMLKSELNETLLITHDVKVLSRQCVEVYNL